MQVTPTGIAVALAVALALGLLFFGTQVFAPFAPRTAGQAATTTDAFATTTMDTQIPSGAVPLPTELPTELTASDTVVGTGAVAAAGDTVTVNYVGMLPDGSVFDASARHGQPFSFTLGAGQVIQGWDLGVVGMKEGGVRRLIIPPAMGYGTQTVGPIPANSTLIFDVQLVEVRK